jgi:hypothetical protein
MFVCALRFLLNLVFAVQMTQSAAAGPWSFITATGNFVVRVDSNMTSFPPATNHSFVFASVCFVANTAFILESTTGAVLQLNTTDMLLYRTVPVNGSCLGFYPLTNRRDDCSFACRVRSDLRMRSHLRLHSQCTSLCLVQAKPVS